MTTWTVSLDKDVSVESPDAVAYVTYTSDDKRTIPGVRIPYEAESDLLKFLARECKRLSALDQRNAEMAAVIASATIAKGPLLLPDLSKQEDVQTAQAALLQKVGAALNQKQIADARVVDPTVADAESALQAAIAAAGGL